MNRNYKRSWRPSAEGLTLVETVIGAAIMAAVLVGLLMISARLNGQRVQAELRTEGGRLADQLLAGWWPTKDKLPRQADGQVPGNPAWRWQTRIVPNESAQKMGGEVVSLEVFGPAPVNGPGQEAAAARVEILLPGTEGK